MQFCWLVSVGLAFRSRVEVHRQGRTQVLLCKPFWVFPLLFLIACTSLTTMSAVYRQNVTGSHDIQAASNQTCSCELDPEKLKTSGWHL